MQLKTLHLLAKRPWKLGLQELHFLRLGLRLLDHLLALPPSMRLRNHFSHQLPVVFPPSIPMPILANGFSKLGLLLLRDHVSQHRRLALRPSLPVRTLPNCSSTPGPLLLHLSPLSRLMPHLMALAVLQRSARLLLTWALLAEAFSAVADLMAVSVPSVPAKVQVLSSALEALELILLPRLPTTPPQLLSSVLELILLPKLPSSVLELPSSVLELILPPKLPTTPPQLLRIGSLA